MKQSHWRIEKFDKENWAFYPLPAIFAFCTDPEYGYWGVGVHFLFWSIEYWSKPIPRPVHEFREEWS